MEYDFSNVIKGSKASFIREILKLTVRKEIISFAGGLPDPSLFPYKEIQCATDITFEKYKDELFQYSTTEGHSGLRDWIAKEFSNTHDVNVSSDQVLIVSGSQQALDLVGKIFINPQDIVAMESPSYLGAIQAFSMYNPVFEEVNLSHDGIDTNQLITVINKKSTKFFYGIPNFQNPTGMTYSSSKRLEIADILKKSGKIMLEDDPYGALIFEGTSILTKSIYSLAPENVIYMGSFSKTFVPGFRIGWIIAPLEIMEKLIIAKQASDLHTNSFVQLVLYEYVMNYDLNLHIASIRNTYATKKKYMIDAIKTYMDENIDIYPSYGGMFVWIRVPNTCTVDLLQYAIKENVAFVPGEAFSLFNGYKDFIRLNFTSLNRDQIYKGIERLQKAILEYRNNNHI